MERNKNTLTRREVASIDPFKRESASRQLKGLVGEPTEIPKKVAGFFTEEAKDKLRRSGYSLTQLTGRPANSLIPWSFGKPQLAFNKKFFSELTKPSLKSQVAIHLTSSSVGYGWGRPINHFQEVFDIFSKTFNVPNTKVIVGQPSDYVELLLRFFDLGQHLTPNGQELLTATRTSGGNYLTIELVKTLPAPSLVFQERGGEFVFGPVIKLFPLIIPD